MKEPFLIYMETGRGWVQSNLRGKVSLCMRKCANVYTKICSICMHLQPIPQKFSFLFNSVCCVLWAVGIHFVNRSCRVFYSLQLLHNQNQITHSLVHSTVNSQ
jgi:hypothetical protein